MPKLVDKKGQRFGRLVVVKRVHVEGARNAMWHCQCDCGNTAVVAGANLGGRNTISCGCYARENNSALNRTHGMSKSAEFGIWQGMQQRCYNSNLPEYRHYGGRGITVCQRWRKDFMAFFADIGPRPSPLHTLDRRDNDGNYEPGNCRWVKTYTQNRNYRLNNIVKIGPNKMCVLDWCRCLNVSRRWAYQKAKDKGVPISSILRDWAVARGWPI